MYGFQLPALTLGKPTQRLLGSANVSNRTSPACSMQTFSRRAVVQFASVAIASTIIPSDSYAFSLADAAVAGDVAKISQGLRKAKELKEMVGMFKAKLADDDSLFILRYVPLWLQPSQTAMKNLPERGANVGDPSKLQTLAGATLGHLLELRTEAKGGDRQRVLDEIDEYIETSEEYLAVPGLQKFNKG